tara:strand:+ start:248 stop:988 length:741 start_codon:yes stop_codon:yes gene_type:complete
MIIVGDIGNTEIKIYFNSKKKSKKILLKTNELDRKNMKKKLNFLKKYNYKDKVLFCSVVPKTFNKIKKFLYQELNLKCVELKKLNLKKVIDIAVNKTEIGSDRLANAISSINNKDNFIIVDFGTATTFDVVIKKKYLGGVIAPGVSLSLDNLVKKAFLIPKIKLNKSKEIIGKNTRQAVTSGFYWGYNGLINNIVKLIKIKTKKKFIIIFTGGLAHLFAKSFKEQVKVDKNLTIKGLIKTSNSLNK